MLKSFSKFINESFNEIKERRIPSWVKEWVWENTPISEVSAKKEYQQWLDEGYREYFVSHHYSDSDDILYSSIQLPSERGRSYNSADAFFVSPHLKLDPGKLNFFVMIPKSLRFLHTDYNFSNVPGFWDDFVSTDEVGGGAFRYLSERCRAAGWDAILPNDGKHEIIILRPTRLVVLGSVEDSRRFQQWINR